MYVRYTSCEFTRKFKKVYLLHLRDDSYISR